MDQAAQIVFLENKNYIDMTKKGSTEKLEQNIAIDSGDSNSVSTNWFQLQAGKHSNFKDVSGEDAIDCIDQFGLVTRQHISVATEIFCCHILTFKKNVCSTVGEFHVASLTGETEDP